MRKNIIALMLVLPLLFVFVVFSSGNAASLGVSVSASGIEILNAPEGGLRIDLAEYDNDFQVVAEVFPENASDKGYSFRVEEVEGSEFASVTVDEDGTVRAQSAGSARVVAVSNDGAYTDSMTVIVSSSKPYDMRVSLYDFAGGEDLLTETEEGYEATLPTGSYRFATSLSPSGFAGAEVKVESGFAVVEGDTVMLPFAGTAVLSFTVEEGAFGAIEKRVTLQAVRRSTVSGITVNGEEGATLSVERSSASASFYVQAESEPVLESNENIAEATVTPAEGAGAGCYIVEVVFTDARADEFTAVVTAGGAQTTITFSFGSFAFDVRSTLPVQGGSVMLESSPVTFYAVSSVMAEGITYKWSVGECEEGLKVSLSPSAASSSCVVTALGTGAFTLVVAAYRNGYLLDIDPVTAELEVVREVTSVQIANRTDAGLAKMTAVAGRTYGEDGALLDYSYALDIRAYRNTEELSSPLSDLEFSVSDPSLAKLIVTDAAVFLQAVGTGEVAVSVVWAGNESFGRTVAASLTLNVVADGVLCDTSGEVFAAADASLPVVLGADVMLGEDIKDDETALRARLGRMKSTYNTEFYENMSMSSEAYVNYVIEFKNDVYGNGFSLNAEYFTNAQDGTGMPLLYRGPLYFVSYGAFASVAAQDNIAYLVRTDGVTLYNVTFLGCSDSSLEEDGQYKLENLNTVGTVLEVNADCNILNCRIRNGRTVVRVYGGNRDGGSYFIESLSQNKGCDEERINVRIEGCVISQGREFLLKVGANRALRANAANGAEPSFTDGSGMPYSAQTNNYLTDEYFYGMYVLTDVTLKNSVLETSGLFSVGMEANFSGMVLAENSAETGINFEGWAGTGGTSFASVLRLEGDVRMYDWKDISLIDSSTLIDSQMPQFDLDIGGMLEFAMHADPESYGDILASYEGDQVVHGGIAVYGGGKNYARLDFGGMNGEVSDFSEYLVNISILADSEDSEMAAQGTFLPVAAGTQDFRFYMYGSGSQNSYGKQLSDAAAGVKYEGITRVSAF
ncbi:MAG TPA: Ig-like domain-containing protein [Candidatus Borkfalkia avistercoris]|uniref:Ig-like domain-containing protein n=1 Tax=Candidatus Borkfalkia avistercoris TaxID=2838504 RepID=A0A9D2A5Y0_9FIRM|nr:Ig-like domain-containing protein [Candidatus Borkfalkia avistercoris]